MTDGRSPTGDEEFARLRGVVYGPDPDAESLRRFEQLLHERQRPVEAGFEAPPESVDEPAPGAVGPSRRRRRALIVGLPAVLVVVALVAAAVQASTTGGGLPVTLDPPPLAGASLVAYGNQRAEGAAVDRTRYDPFGYTVFQPSGGSLHVALRCVGAGTVVITAGQRFPFRCTGPERVLHLDDERAHLQPFVVGGITDGDVVWAVRITERPLPGSNVANLSKRLGSSG